MMSRLTYLGRANLFSMSVFIMAANVVNAASGFLFWRWAAVFSTTYEVGLAATAISMMGLLSLLSLSGVDYAIIRYLPGSEGPKTLINSCLTTGTVLSVVVSMVFLVGLGFWSPIFSNLRSDPLFISLVISGAVLTTASAILVATYIARRQSCFILFHSVLFGVGRVCLVALLTSFMGWAGISAAWAVALVAATCFGVFMFLPVLENRRYRFELGVDLHVLDSLKSFASLNYVAVLLWSAPTFVLPLLIVSMAGPSVNAFFYIAWNVNGLLSMIPTSVSLSLFAHGSHDEEKLARRTADAGWLILCLLLPAIGATFVLAPKILLLFGSTYSEHATQLLRVLALSPLPMAANFLFFSVRRVQHRMTAVVACTAWILVATLGLSALLLPRIGLVGVGAAWLAAQISVAVVVVLEYALDAGKFGLAA